MQGVKWKMSKAAIKNMLLKINEILNISDSYKAPSKMMLIIKNDEVAKSYYFKFLEAFDYDMSYEWFTEYFEDEHADRKNNKQDFTPTSISKLMSEMFQKAPEKGIIYEPAAGTGSTIISHWYNERMKCAVWNYNPLEYLYVCEELSDKTIPFLLFNLLIRGINAVVIHGNTLTREAKAIYHCFNEYNDPMGFSNLFELPKNEKTARIFDVKWDS